MNASLRRSLPGLLVVLAFAAGGFPTGATPARAEEPAAAADPFTYEAPSGWKPERIPFPLGFAPSLAYTGFEQLHFAPGMFDPKSDNYFTYLFFWWVEGEPTLTEESLARELAEYYRGLTAAVGRPKGLELDLTKVDATVVAAAEGKSADEAKSGPASPATRRFTGRLNTFDPFNTGQALALEVEITAWRCDRENRTVVFFGVSPRPKDAAAQWTPMRTALASFRCRVSARDETPTLRAEGQPLRSDSMPGSRRPSESRTPNDGPGSARGRAAGGSGPLQDLVATKARILKSPRPVYPVEARASGIQGNVVVRVVLGADRSVKSATVVRGLGPEIDEEARKAAFRLVFEPAHDAEDNPGVVRDRHRARASAPSPGPD